MIAWSRITVLLLVVPIFTRCLGTALPTAPAAEFDYTLNESPPLPTPAWVRFIDQGEQNSDLSGLITPAGIKVEIVAQEPVVIDPVGMTFAADGTPYVLEWRVADDSRHISYEVTFRDGTKATVDRMEKSVRDELKTLTDADGDGRYEAANVIMNDLEIPSSVMLHDGWVYLSSIGHVVRRRRSEEGGPYDQEEEIVRGLCGFHHHQASGMTISHDGWLFVTSGDDDNHGEGSDGSRATVLRTGAIMRMRPDGSRLAEFARGFRNPYRDVAFDHMFNMFHVDNDQEDGSKFQGCRLMHVQEAADYGWRLAQETLCCRTDFARGAVFGELPGKMPSMLKTGRGSPAGLLIYQSEQFPDFFQGLLIYPDVYRRMVRAYRVRRTGSTFEVVEQFELMKSDDPLFRPCQAVLGPDGAIYVVDWRTDSGGAGRLWGDGEHGRIYRLSWSGTDESPAIPLAPIDRWAGLADAPEEELWRQFEDTPDFEVRRRMQQELVRRGEGVRARFLAIATDPNKPGPARASALGASCYFYDESVEAAAISLLNDEDFEMVRLAADALSRHTTPPRVNARLLTALTRTLKDAHPAARRAAALALGQTAGLLDGNNANRRHAAAHLLEALSDVNREDDVYLHDGILRGLERTGATGINLLVALTLSDDAADRELGVASLEALRTAPAAEGLDQVVSRADRLTQEQWKRVLSAYRHILVEPAIDASAVGEWILAHPEADDTVKLAGLETLALVGGTNPESTLPVVMELLNHRDAAIRLGVISVIGQNYLVGAARPLVDALSDERRGVDERRTIVETLGKLRSREMPWGKMTGEGVELVVDELATVAALPVAAPIKADVVRVLGSVDFEKARPLAQALLDSDRLEDVQAAVSVLGADREESERLAQRFIDGELPKGLLPQIAGALQRHAEQDTSGRIAALLNETFKGGLLLSLDPAEVAEVEKLVETTGDARNGRSVFLNAQKSQCANCHRLEGTGGLVGPDLTRIWETHTVAKILESMIDPSKEIKEGFQSYTAVTDSGQVYQGLKVRDDGQEVVLRDQDGKDITIATDDLDELDASKKSLMPEGVVAQLSYQEFIDLVAFLKDRDEQAALHGMLTQVWVAGPYGHALNVSDAVEQNPDPFSQPKGPGGENLSWQRLGANPDGLFDVKKVHDLDDAAVYALAYVHSPEAQTARFSIWFDDELRLIVNGRTVHSSESVHTDEVIDVPLEEGWNTVLARVVNHRGDFAFRMSIAEGDGLRFSDLPK